MHDSTIWDVRCNACAIEIGQVAEGRFVHDPECTLPQRVDGGAMKCCRCDGALQAVERELRAAGSEARA